MEEDMAVTEQGDVCNDEGESSGETVMKKSVGLKKLQVCVTDISLLEPDLSNNSVKRGRGRPKGSTRKSNITKDSTPKKRGRPKGSTNSKKAAAGELLNGGTPKRQRGRPKGSVKRKLDVSTSGDESEDSFAPPRKRGSPQRSTKKAKLETGTSEEDEAETLQNTPKRGPGRPRKGESKGKRGRPRKVVEDGANQQAPITDGTQHVSSRRGRPKGSRNKPIMIVTVERTSGRPTRPHNPPDKLDTSLPRKIGKRGRPKKHGKRGRPRKNPLPPGEEELYQPKVWKPLGRPRKYPRDDCPEGEPAPDTPRRGRGRPRKSESKKGAYFRKSDSAGPPRKRGRPTKAAKEQEGPPRKRGRPKGSVNKNKAIIDNTSGDCSTEVIPESAPLEDDLEENKVISKEDN